MIGFPGQIKEDLQRTLDFAMSLGLDYSIFCIITPFPETELYDICIKNGALRKNVLLRDFRASKGVIKSSSPSSEYLEKFRKEAWLKLNFSSSLYNH